MIQFQVPDLRILMTENLEEDTNELDVDGDEEVEVHPRSNMSRELFAKELTA